MTSVKHALVSALTDLGEPGKVSPVDWNQDHVITISEPPPVIYQSSTGDDAFEGWWDRPKLTVQAAMNVLGVSGGIVQLGAGTFPQSVSLLPPVIPLSGTNGAATIRGRGAHLTTLSITSADYLFKVGNQDSVTRTMRVYFEDMKMLGAHASSPGAIQINGVSYGAVRRCSLRNFPVADGAGITNVPGTHCYFWVIEENDFQDSPHAIWGRGSGGIGFQGNYIQFNHYGSHNDWVIKLDSVSGNFIGVQEFNGSITNTIFLGGTTAYTKIIGPHFDGPTVAVRVDTSSATDNDLLSLTGTVTGSAIVDNGTRSTIIAGDFFRIKGVDVRETSGLFGLGA